MNGGGGEDVILGIGLGLLVMGVGLMFWILIRSYCETLPEKPADEAKPKEGKLVRICFTQDVRRLERERLSETEIEDRRSRGAAVRGNDVPRDGARVIAFTPPKK